MTPINAPARVVIEPNSEGSKIFRSKKTMKTYAIYTLKEPKP